MGFSLFFNGILMPFGSFNYSKMAKYRFLIDSNTFWMDFGTSKISNFFGPVVDPDSPYFSWIYFKKYKKKSGNILGKSGFWISQLSGIPKFRHFLDLLTPIFFVSYLRNSPQKLRMINGVFVFFWWNNSKSSIILKKWKIISKS